MLLAWEQYAMWNHLVHLQIKIDNRRKGCLKAERQANLEAEQNGGVPSKDPDYTQTGLSEDWK